MASPELPFATWRFRDIPASYDLEKFCDIVPLSNGERILYSSLAPDPYTNAVTKVGTITWDRVPEYLQYAATSNDAGVRLHLLELSEDAASTEPRANGIWADAKFIGLTPLNAGSLQTENVSIIAVTGVGGKPFMSWQHESGAMWLRDFLPRDVPNARVYTYGYPSTLQRSGSRARLLDYTTHFLEELLRLCEHKPQPLILIGHSFGGLMVKQAIVESASPRSRYGKVFNSIYSVFFFGTPHRGLNTAAIEEMVHNEPTKDMIKDLRENSNLIRSLSESFPAAAGSLQIVTCRELLETGTMQLQDGIWKRTGPKEMMVTETSACLYLPNEERIPIYANHSMIAKLGDGPETPYRTIRDRIASHVSGAPSIIRRRVLRAEGAATIFEVCQLANFVEAIVCKIKKTPPPSTRVKESMKDQVSFLEHFATFLFDHDLAKILEDPDLSILYTEEVVACLHQLNDVFSSYRALAGKYIEPFGKAVGHSETQRPIGELYSHEEDALDIAVSDVFHDRSPQDTLFQDQTLINLVRQCRESTERLKITLAFVTLRSFELPDNERLGRFRRSMELGGAIPAKIAIRQHVFAQPGSGDDDAEPLEGHLEKCDLSNKNSDLQFAKFYRKDISEVQDVIVEYRKYEADPRVEGPYAAAAMAQRQYLAKLKRNMRQLAALLRESSFVVELMTEGGLYEEDGIGAFRCLGFVEDSDRYQLAYIFEIPVGMTAQSLAASYSLSTYIESDGKGPSTVEKLQIAQVLCQNILNLHASGWVHKNIRSQNIILVRNHGGASGDSEGVEKYYMQYLKGFEFSRPDSGRSSGRANFDPNQNLYRHPERQNVPDTHFMKEHDLYAVGVVLLEIGLWKTIPRVFHKHIEAARQGRSFPQPHTIRDQLVRLARKTSLGVAYKEAVTTCLTGDFCVSKDGRQQVNLGLAFRQHVSDVVEARLKSGDLFH